MIVFKFISLVISIWLSIVTWGCIKNNQDVPALNLLIQSMSIATFCFIQFDLF